MQICWKDAGKEKDRQHALVEKPLEHRKKQQKVLNPALIYTDPQVSFHE